MASKQANGMRMRMVGSERSFSSSSDSSCVELPPTSVGRTSIIFTGEHEGTTLALLKYQQEHFVPT